MLNFFKKDPGKKLRKKYERLMLEARDLQRSGDIKAFAQKSAEAEEVMKELEQLGAK